MKSNKTNQYKVTLIQNEKRVTFRLNQMEYDGLKKCCVPHFYQRLYAFVAFTWAECYLSYYKRKRFYSNFTADYDFKYEDENDCV